MPTPTPQEWEDRFDKLMLEYLDYVGVRGAALFGRPTEDGTYPEFGAFKELISQELTAAREDERRLVAREIGFKGEALARLDLIRKLDRIDDEEAHFFDGDAHTMTMTRKDYDLFRLWLSK